MERSDVAAGARVLGGRYALERLIGVGATAEVWLATDAALGRRVAVKILNPALAADELLARRFKREAEAAAGVNHPNVISVYDWGAVDTTNYIVMEYAPGGNLKEAIQRRGAFPESEALAIGAQVAAALHAAHRQGLIHRDVKPHNVLLDAGGQVKVGDFGIARASRSSQLTEVSTVLGSAAYMSPEQARGDPLDARSDLYSLGIVLFELLTGRLPFAADSPVAIAWLHQQAEPPRPRAVTPAISAAAEEVVLRALAKDPDSRHATADEMRAALERTRSSAFRSAAVDATQVLAAPAPRVATTSALLRVSEKPTTALPQIQETSPTATRLVPIPAGRGRSPEAPTPSAQPLDRGRATSPPAAVRSGLRRRRAARLATLSALVLSPILVAAALLSRTLGPFDLASPPAPSGNASQPVAGTPGADSQPGRSPVALATPPPAPSTAPPTERPAAPTAAPSAANSPTVAPTPMPTVAAALRPTTAATGVPAPTAAAAPTTAPAPPPVSPPGVASAAVSAAPVEAVASFYDLVEQRQFERAASLWSSRMQAAYPPAENITRRFSQTQQLRLERAAVVAQDEAGGRATVAIDLVEVAGSPPAARRYVGSWQLVRGPAGWLLDRPNLAAG